MTSFIKRFLKPSPANPTLPSNALHEYELTLSRAHEELSLKTEAHHELWGLREASWDADLEAGTLTFTLPNGRQAIAPVQIVGTFDVQAGTWMWGWDHPSVPEGCRLHARKTYDYGVIHHLSDLTSRILACNEARAWDFVALATHLNEAQGAYRGSTGNTLVFMTFGSATLNSPQKEDKPDGSAS